MIFLDVLYLALRKPGISEKKYLKFGRHQWYRSLSFSDAVQLHESQSRHYVEITDPTKFLGWAESCGFWSEEEINRLASLVLLDLMKGENSG